MRYLMTLLVVLLLLGCKKDAPKPPEAAQLSFPLQNSECTTGIDLNATTSEVEFRWERASNAESYELKVTNVDKNITQNTTTRETSAKLPLEKGALFSWVVVTQNSQTEETPSSATWQFFNAGSRTTYPPFPAKLIVPGSGSTAVRDINNEVTLEWSGADVDNDIIGYDVYLSTTTPPEDLIASPSATTTKVKVGIQTGTTYYWNVITKDGEGNTSDSGIFSFKAI